MKKIKINTVNAPQAVGSYEQAIKVGDFVYTSGQIALKADGSLMFNECVEEQTKQVMHNLKAILEAANSSLDKMVKATIFVKDINNFAIIDKIYSSFFKGNYPARSCVEISQLPKGVKIKIEAIAVV